MFLTQYQILKIETRLSKNGSFFNCEKAAVEMEYELEEMADSDETIDSDQDDDGFSDSDRDGFVNWGDY